MYSDRKEHEEAILIAGLVEEWVLVSPVTVSHANSFIEHPKFGKQLVSWKVINPIKLVSRGIKEMSEFK